jgi:hypothetical protein
MRVGVACAGSVIWAAFPTGSNGGGGGRPLGPRDGKGEWNNEEEQQCVCVAHPLTSKVRCGDDESGVLEG